MKLVNQLLTALREARNWGISLGDVTQHAEYSEVVNLVDKAIEAGNDFQKEKGFQCVMTGADILCMPLNALDITDMHRGFVIANRDYEAAVYDYAASKLYAQVRTALGLTIYTCNETETRDMLGYCLDSGLTIVHAAV